VSSQTVGYLPADPDVANTVLSAYPGTFMPMTVAENNENKRIEGRYLSLRQLSPVLRKTGLIPFVYSLLGQKCLCKLKLFQAKQGPDAKSGVLEPCALV
jgi:hypothetical protein